MVFVTERIGIVFRPFLRPPQNTLPNLKFQ